MFHVRFARKFRPMRLSPRLQPFNSADRSLEIKHDGFRAVARIEIGAVQCYVEDA